MFKIIGGDYVGYNFKINSKGITLRHGKNEVMMTRSDVSTIEVLDSTSHTSGVRMAAKSYVFSKVGLGGLWGGLSAKSKRTMLIGIAFTNGRTLVMQTSDSGYRKLLKYTY